MHITVKQCLFSLMIFLASCQGSEPIGEAPPKELGNQRPNILFAVSDDQSYPHASAYGYEAIQTPAFDRVAREGILFHNAFAASPGCSPSRAAMLTGLNCWQIENAGTHGSSFPAQYVVYPDLLEKSGYFIGYTHKAWGPGDYEISGRNRNPVGEPFNEHILNSPEGIASTDYAANFEYFLEQRPNDQPFFFWYGSSEPHRIYKKGIGAEHGMDASKVKVPPFLPDEEEVRNDILDYGYEIQWFDQHLGRMLEILEEAGELDNTLIIVTSDNGMPFPRAKANVYEYGIHMPLAIRWGDQIKGGREVDDLVNLIDFYSTFLDVAGADYPEYPLESNSLLNILASDAEGVVDSSRRAVYSSRERHSSSRWANLGYPQRALRTHDYLYIRNSRPERWPAGAPQKLKKNGTLEEMHMAYHDIDNASTNFVITQRDEPDYEKYFHLAVDKRPAEELFNIKKDPGCLYNLAALDEHQETLRKMRSQMGAYLMATNDPRVTGNGDIFETYERLRGPMREFPEPEWVKQSPQPIRLP